MLLEATDKPIRVKLQNQPELLLKPGEPVNIPTHAARQLLRKAGSKVRVSSPLPPLQSGWLVSYRGPAGALCGGCDDRVHGTIQGCIWHGMGWTVCLTDGHQLPLGAITAVTKTDPRGHTLGCWEVRRHGYDGEGRQ